MKDINIIFVNYKMKDDVLCAVDSVFKDVASCPYQIQITIADNSSNQDGVKEALAERFPLVIYMDSGGNVGFGKGCNIGFASSEARYYCTLNPDTVIPENSHTMERIIRFMDEHLKIGMIWPKLLNTDGTIQESCYRFDLPSILIKPLKHINLDKKYQWVKKHAGKLMMREFDHNETRPVDWVMGSAMVARKEAVDEVGWFDDRYFMYMEDCDWCHKMWEAGWPVYYVHNIAITHKYTRESAKVPGVWALFKNKLARIHLASWLKYLWKWRKSHKYYAA